MAFFLTYRPPMATLGEHIRQSNAYKWWILGMIMLGTFMAVLDVTVVNVGLPAIMSAFGIGISTAEWVITAYMITMTVMLPSAGWFEAKTDILVKQFDAIEVLPAKTKARVRSS